MGLFDWISDVTESLAETASINNELKKEERKIANGKSFNKNLPENLKAKFKAMEEAAIRDKDTDRLIKLGNSYINERPNDPGYDPDKALELWTIAANLGSASAQYNIGWLYHFNIVYENNNEAGYWFNKAANNGHEKAKKMLAKHYEYSKMFGRWLRRY